MEIVWSSFATEGLFSILEYVETDFGSRVSQRVYTDIMGYIETLTKFPNLGIHDDIFSTETLEVRYLICRQNIIYYLIYKETIYLLSIANSNQSSDRIRKVIADYLRLYK